MKIMAAAVMVTGVLWLQSPVQAADTPTVVAQAPTDKPAQAPSDKSTPAGKMPGRSAAEAVKIRGTVEAVDKAKGTVTLKGPEGRTMTLHLKDPSKLDAVKVGDPVVATYMEAVAFRVKKAGTATPGTSAQETRVTSKPGEAPAGAIGQQVTVTATITGIDKKNRTVTIKGPEGNTETVKVRHAKNLDAVKVGDMVEITYTRALAISLDKPAQK